MAYAEGNDRHFRPTKARSTSMAKRFLAYVKRFCPYSPPGRVI
jgi:hypothetical protein